MLTQRKYIAGAALLVLMGGTLAWSHWRTRVPVEELAAFLDKAVGAGRVQFAVTRIESHPGDGAGLHLTVTAAARAPQPLFAQVDAAEYLRTTFQFDPEATADARQVLADRGISQNPDFQAARPFPADPCQAVILKQVAPAGATFTFQGDVDARRDNGAWSFSVVSGGFERDGPQGEARPTFGESSFTAGDAGDDARLRALTVDLQAFAGRIADIRKRTEAVRAAAIDARRNAFLAQIAPGRFFRGSALEAGEQRGTPLYMEIAGVSAGNEVTALLRNEGSWHTVRVFQGTWSADDAFETPTLDLSSNPDQAVRGAGSFLENTQNWTLSLSADHQGRLTGQSGRFKYRFEPMGLDQASALRARLGAEFDGAVAATEPGALYQGTATSRASGESEPILLRFNGQADGGESIDASIESTTRSWKRPLHGTVVANSRRSGGEPIRLETGSSDAVEDAPGESVLGRRDDLELSLGFDQGTLTGGDAQYTYQLSPAGDADLHRLEAGRAERARRLKAVLREGIAYDGVLREDQGFISHARLEITQVGRQSGEIAARIRSLVRLDIHRDFAGACDPSGGSISLSATNRGVFETADSFDVPFLKVPDAATLHLALSGDAITGRIEGDPHWTIEFPVGVFLSAPTEAPDSLAGDVSAFPPFPAAAGAYLLTRASWSALPLNQGKVVVETVKEESNLEIPSNIIGALNEGIAAIDSEKKKKAVPYLEFGGKDPRPESGEQAVVILFVGAAPTGGARIELSSAETLKDGRRRIRVAGGPGEPLRLRGTPAPAYVRQIAPGRTLLTTTSTLAPGPYVFVADAGYEFTQD